MPECGIVALVQYKHAIVRFMELRVRGLRREVFKRLPMTGFFYHVVVAEQAYVSMNVASQLGWNEDSTYYRTYTTPLNDAR